MQQGPKKIWSICHYLQANMPSQSYYLKVKVHAEVVLFSISQACGADFFNPIYSAVTRTQEV